jgi:hypothetical protein
MELTAVSHIRDERRDEISEARTLILRPLSPALTAVACVWSRAPRARSALAREPRHARARARHLDTTHHRCENLSHGGGRTIRRGPDRRRPQRYAATATLCTSARAIRCVWYRRRKGKTSCRRIPLALVAISDRCARSGARRLAATRPIRVCQHPVRPASAGAYRW